jgi:hypothetical protein
MPFAFRRSGSFTGPGFDLEYRDNDDFSPQISNASFPNDVGMILVNTLGSPDDYVYMHLAGTYTSNVTLEASYGDISVFNVNATQTNFSGTVSATNFIGTWYGNSVGSVKAFDISHPTKENHRLRYICLEGPQAEVYCRGKLKDTTVIELPDYWKNLVDMETVGVSLTPIGSYQELFVEKIEWGTRIIVKNNASGPINCSYIVYGERKDIQKNITEYEGTSPKDYPGEVIPYEA